MSRSGARYAPLTAGGGLPLTTNSNGGANQALDLHDSVSGKDVYARARSGGGVQWLNNAFSAEIFTVDDGGQLYLFGPTSATASAGAKAAPPATVAGYLNVTVSGTAVRIPYYLP